MLEKEDLKLIKEVVEISLDEKLGQKLDEKLEPIFLRLDSISDRLTSIERDIEMLKEKVDRITKTENEDIIALNKQIEKISERQDSFEKQLRSLQAQTA